MYTLSLQKDGQELSLPPKFHDSSLISSTGRLISIHICEPFLTRVGSLQQLRDFLSHHPAISHLSLQDMADGSPSRSARLLCSCCVIYISFLVASQSHSRTGSFVLGYFSSNFFCCLTKLVLSMVTRLEHPSSFRSKVLSLHLDLHIGIEEASEGFVLALV